MKHTVCSDLKMFFSKMSTKNGLKKCSQRMFPKTFPKECSQRMFPKNVPKEYSQRISPKNVPKECSKRMSRKNVLIAKFDKPLKYIQKRMTNLRKGALRACKFTVQISNTQLIVSFSRGQQNLIKVFHDAAQRWIITFIHIVD